MIIVRMSGMASSDKWILHTLEKLISQHGAETPITQEVISEVSEIPLRTTKRALKRLRATGAVIAERTAPRGYRYRIPDGATVTND